LSEWRVLLIGGTTAVGKSTSGALVAQRLGIPCLSADSVWKVLMAATTPESHPDFHHFEPPPEVHAKGPDHLLQLHIATAEAMTPALDAFLDWEVHEANRFVFQGAWITPELAAKRCASGTERAVFIDEREEQEILGSMMRRSGRSAQGLDPLPRQLSISAMAWRYGNWLRRQTTRLGLPAVAARPRETLVERIIAAAG
jgi:2-phosphoglycerate kinase